MAGMRPPRSGGRRRISRIKSYPLTSGMARSATSRSSWALSKVASASGTEAATVTSAPTEPNLIGIGAGELGVLDRLIEQDQYLKVFGQLRTHCCLPPIVTRVSGVELAFPF